MDREEVKPKIWLFALIFFAIFFSIAIFYDYPTPDQISAEREDAGIGEEVKEVAKEEKKAEEKKEEKQAEKKEKKKKVAVAIEFRESYDAIPPMFRRQLGAINVDPLKNCGRGCGSNIGRMRDFGITIPNWIDDVDSYTLCADGMGCIRYSEMRKRWLDILQPKDQVCNSDLSDLECENLRVKNVVLMVSVLAVAQGQILLFHHGECMDGWDDISVEDGAKWNDPDVIQKWNNVNWEKNLKIIHRWINSPEIAEDYMLNVVMKFANNHGPHTKKIGARYFGGGMKNWGKEAWDKVSSIGSKKKYKHPNDYGRDIAKCYRRNTGYKWSISYGSPNNLRKRDKDEPAAPWNRTIYKDSDILVLKGCFFGKETGGEHAEFKGRPEGRAEVLEKKWKKRGIEIDLISPEEAKVIFTDDPNQAPQPPQTKSIPSAPVPVPVPTSAPAPKTTPTPAKQPADSSWRCVDGKMCKTRANGADFCFTPTVPCS